MQKFSAEREQISDETLNIMLSKFIEKMEKFDFVMYPTFKILYDHGFRIKEVLEAKRWKLNDNGIFRVETEKGSLPRFINYSEIEGRYRNELDYANYTDKLLNYSQVKRRFESYFNAQFFTENNRKLITHLFRHNFVKQKYNQGLSIEEISKIIGEINKENTRGYVESKIYKENWHKLQF